MLSIVSPCVPPKPVIPFCLVIDDKLLEVPEWAPPCDANEEIEDMDFYLGNGIWRCLDGVMIQLLSTPTGVHECRALIADVPKLSQYCWQKVNVNVPYIGEIHAEESICVFDDEDHVRDVSDYFAPTIYNLGRALLMTTEPKNVSPIMGGNHRYVGPFDITHRPWGWNYSIDLADIIGATSLRIVLKESVPNRVRLMYNGRMDPITEEIRAIHADKISVEVPWDVNFEAICPVELV